MHWYLSVSTTKYTFMRDCLNTHTQFDNKIQFSPLYTYEVLSTLLLSLHQKVPVSVYYSHKGH